MNYKQLQASLKGHTSIKLNSKASVLQAEYDRLFLDGSFCELTCELPAVAPKTTAPTVKHQHKAQAESELKRQLSQAPRHRTAVADKYINKPQVNEVRQQAIKGSDKKVSCKFNTTHNEFFVNTTHKRFNDSLGTTEKQALDNVKQFVNAVKQVAIGFHNAQVKRNAA